MTSLAVSFHNIYSSDLCYSASIHSNYGNVPKCEFWISYFRIYKYRLCNSFTNTTTAYICMFLPSPLVIIPDVFTRKKKPSLYSAVPIIHLRHSRFCFCIPEGLSSPHQSRLSLPFFLIRFNLRVPGTSRAWLSCKICPVSETFPIPILLKNKRVSISRWWNAENGF